MSTTQIAQSGQDTVIQADLYMSLELGDKQWRLTLSDGRRGPSRYGVDAGDTATGADCIRKAKERCGFAAEAKAHSCYEAGRDGRGVHRWQTEEGIDSGRAESARAAG